MALIHQSPPLLPFMLALILLRFLFSFCNWPVFVFLCFSGQHIAKGKAFLIDTNSRWCFLSYWLADSRVSFVWHSFVWRETRRESLIMCGGACFSNNMHEDLIRTQSCQKHNRVLIYPFAASDAGCLLNWYVGSGTHKKGGNSAFFVQQ